MAQIEGDDRAQTERTEFVRFKAKRELDPSRFHGRSFPAEKVTHYNLVTN